jgi:hypothetical protein
VTEDQDSTGNGLRPTTEFETGSHQLVSRWDVG